MTRLRTVLAPPNTAEEETSLVRSFTVPSARDFGLVGTARLDLGAPDPALDAALGIPGASAGGVTATASEHLTTTALARASSALDGNPATAWTTQVGDPTGQWIDVRLAHPTTVDHLDLQVVADGRHSVPTQLQIDAGGQTRTVSVPPVPDQPAENATVSAPVRFPALTGADVRVTITAVRPVDTTEYYTNLPTPLPVGIAELGIPGVQRPPLPATLPGDCRADLLTVDGRPYPVRVVGSAATAASGGTATVESCNPSGGAAAPLRLGAGAHELRATPGASTGINLDGLVLASGIGGAGVALDAPAGSTAAPAAAAPRVHVTGNGETTIHARVQHPTGPFWLVLGESFNSGWRATVNGHDLGAPKLVDGISNGWRVNPKDGRPLSVTFTWTPQRRIWIALAISAVTMVLCTALALRPRRPRIPVDAAHVDRPLAFRSPFGSSGSPPSRRAVVSTTLAVAIASSLLVTWWMGLVVGAVTLAVLLRPPLRWLLTVGAPAALAAAGAYVVVQQTRHLYPAVFEWPTFFDAVHVVALLAVLLLAADAVVELVRSRRRGDWGPDADG
jgi:hypothetical protein